MSAESGVPTYRGRGGTWERYQWEEYACQEAFERDPEGVLRFHALRRQAVLQCKPHAGHEAIVQLEKNHGSVTVVTQNIDGMHQRAGSRNVIELHGSLWRLRCPDHGVIDDVGERYTTDHCDRCGGWLRPDIVWFCDNLDEAVVDRALTAISSCDLLVSIGTSGVVWPAAGFPVAARENGAQCVEINPEETDMSYLYETAIREPAALCLPNLFDYKLL